jgi:hypothetical protein
MEERPASAVRHRIARKVTSMTDSTKDNPAQSAKGLAMTLNHARIDPMSPLIGSEVIHRHPAVDRLSWKDWAIVSMHGFAIVPSIPTCDGRMIVWDGMRWIPLGMHERRQREQFIQDAFQIIADEMEMDSEADNGRWI